MKNLWKLYLEFFKIGLFTFGGGYAMISMIQREIVEKKQWISTDELTDYVAVANCTPGIIAVNTATFVGNKRGGVIGGVVATLGVVSPSFFIIGIISHFLMEFAENPYLEHVLAGVRVAVIALVLQTLITMYRNAVKDKLGIILCLAAFVAVAFLGLSSIWMVLAGAFVGIAAKQWAEGRK